MKRLLVALAIFFGSILMLQAVLFVPAFVRIVRGHATGIAFVVGRRSENLVRIAVLMALALIAYWLSGRFVKA